MHYYIDAQLHFGNLKLSEIVIYFLSVISIKLKKASIKSKLPIFWVCAVEQFRQSLCCFTIPNVSISRCAQVMLHFRKSYLLRSSINIRSNLLQGIINKSSKVQALFVNVITLRKTEKRGPFRKNKTPLRGIEPFSNSIFMVLLSQIPNIRHLEI